MGFGLEGLSPVTPGSLQRQCRQNTETGSSIVTVHCGRVQGNLLPEQLLYQCLLAVISNSISKKVQTAAAPAKRKYFSNM